MSVEMTEAIFDVVDRASRGFGLPDAELDQRLAAIGCTRIARTARGELVVWYPDPVRKRRELFVICNPNGFLSE